MALAVMLPWRLPQVKWHAHFRHRLAFYYHHHQYHIWYRHCITTIKNPAPIMDPHFSMIISLSPQLTICIFSQVFSTGVFLIPRRSVTLPSQASALLHYWNWCQSISVMLKSLCFLLPMSRLLGCYFADPVQVQLMFDCFSSSRPSN